MMNTTEFENLLVSKGLYSSLTYQNSDINDVANFLAGKIAIDIYCPLCGDKRIHKARPNKIKKPSKMPVLQLIDSPVEDNSSLAVDTFFHNEEEKRINQFSSDNRHTLLTYECTKDSGHNITFVIMLTSNKIIKIGQYPSFADIDKPELKKFKKELGEQYFQELKRASGLNATGVGIGSFVYLRRIIENLVYEAFKEAESEHLLTSEEFNHDSKGHQRRMDEKIKLLKGFLPQALTDKPAVYGIVSKGIHELTEEECLMYFPVIENGIKLILEEKIAERQKAAIKKQYDQAIDSIVQEIQ